MSSDRARSILRVAMIAVAIWIAAPAAFAQHVSRTVRFEGRPLFRVWGTTSEDALRRASRIERRLEILVDQSERPPRAVVQRRGPERMVHVGAVLVTSVTPLDAQEELTSIDVVSSRWARAIDAALQRARARRVSWGRFASAVDGSVRTAFARVGESAITIVPRLIAGLLVVCVFWILAAAVRGLLAFLFRRFIDDRTIESFIKQLVYYFIWIIGIIIAIHALGFDPASAVAALGLTSLALGFALKDILSNLVSGILMLAFRPFEIGDQIVVGDTEGAVEQIRLRATHIRTYDGRLVQVPNAELFTSRVTNNTASPQRRTNVEIPLAYTADVVRALELARKATEETEGVSMVRPPTARLRELGAADMLLEVQFWTDSRRSDVVSTAAAVRAAIVAVFQSEHVTLPDASRRIVTIEKPGES